MEFVFLDNGLINRGGHCYHLAKVVSQCLSRRKLRYRWFGVRALDPSLAAEIGVVPHFRHSLWDSVHLTPLERLQRLLTRLRGKVSRHSPTYELRTWRTINRSFEQDLRALPQDVWSAGNLIVLPSITQNQIMGLIRVLRAMPRDQLPRTVCHLMFSPSFVPWGELSALGKRFYGEAFALAAPLVDRTLFFTVDNEAMQAAYAQDFGMRTQILPIPFAASASQAQGTSEGRARVGFFGLAKCEKGFHLLPRAIELCQHAGLDAEFVIQVQHANWERQTVEAERALRALKGVRILKGPLASEEYGAWTGQMDVMLLPYDPVAFGPTRSSGIFAESVASGRPVVASQGTLAALSISEGAAEGEIFAPHTSEALAAAIMRLLPRLPACKALAAKRAKDYALSHSPDAYVELLLRLANAQESSPG